MFIPKSILHNERGPYQSLDAENRLNWTIRNILENAKIDYASITYVLNATYYVCTLVLINKNPKSIIEEALNSLDKDEIIKRNSNIKSIIEEYVWLYLSVIKKRTDYDENQKLKDVIDWLWDKIDLLGRETTGNAIYLYRIFCDPFHSSEKTLCDIGRINLTPRQMGRYELEKIDIMKCTERLRIENLRTLILLTTFTDREYLLTQVYQILQSVYFEPYFQKNYCEYNCDGFGTTALGVVPKELQCISDNECIKLDFMVMNEGYGQSAKETNHEDIQECQNVKDVTNGTDEKVNFTDIINQEKLKEKSKTQVQFINRLHQLIDNQCPSIKGRVICKALIEEYLLDSPSNMTYSKEFNGGEKMEKNEFESIAKYFRHWKTIHTKEQIRVNGIIIF